MGMRKIAGLFLSFAGVLIMGLIWTVGQTGLSDTNAHLCELFSRYFPEISENCQASDWIVRTAGYLFFLAVATTVLDIGWIIFKWPSKKPKEIPSNQTSPLEIIFDPTNPSKKFWSIEQMRDENGKQIAGSFWEYRAAIKNKSARTVKNVKVTVEAIGIMPTRPIHSNFDINKKTFIDLTPNEETLAIIRTWFNPPLVQGMAIGEGIYGPLNNYRLAPVGSCS
jgi:hypothetical protein